MSADMKTTEHTEWKDGLSSQLATCVYFVSVFFPCVPCVPWFDI
jgi:hypothetical protein